MNLFNHIVALVSSLHLLFGFPQPMLSYKGLLDFPNSSMLFLSSGDIAPKHNGRKENTGKIKILYLAESGKDNARQALCYLNGFAFAIS